MSIKEKTISDIKVGGKVEFTKTISETDVYLFAGITCDNAQHHINKEFAKNTMFGDRIVHGLLTASLTSSCISQIVAPGGIALSNSFKYLKAVKFGDTITAKAEVTEIIVNKKIVKIRTTCTNQKGELVLDGESVQLMRIR
jgi:3-hydroxybutyryl-CoA dehydratase